MAFVTKYKFKRTIGKLNWNYKANAIFNILKNKYFYLDDTNLKEITTCYLFIQDPKKFIHENEITWKDAGINAIEKKPAFHLNDDCIALLEDFDNVLLPKIVRESFLLQAREIARKLGLYRWGQKTETELNNYVIECLKVFNSDKYNLNLNLSDFKVIIKKKNSGGEPIKNYPISDIKFQLNAIVRESENYFARKSNTYLEITNDFFKNPCSNPQLLNFHNRNQVLHFYRNRLNYMFDERFDMKEFINLTDFCNNNEILNICKEVHDNFLSPTVELINSAIFQNMNEVSIADTSILQLVGFKPCGFCGGIIDKMQENISSEADKVKNAEKVHND